MCSPANQMRAVRLAQERPEPRHLTRGEHGVTTSCVALVGAGLLWHGAPLLPALRVDDVELLLERGDPGSITERSAGSGGVPGHELGSTPGRSALPGIESVASHPTPKGRSVMVNPTVPQTTRIVGRTESTLLGTYAADHGSSRESRAASAAPRAPAMSRSGMRANVATSRCSSRSEVCSRTLARNHFAELRRGLDDAPADEVGVRIDEVARDREQPPECHRLLIEDLERQGVFGVAETRTSLAASAIEPALASSWWGNRVSQ